ncbi:hypothetical protein FOA43_001262 [Brettanomyces nanus]|uniref:Uncharacterized protein n=1 Tax=Eeniella nana TaxID=13502 RepID=A0A875RTX1_EENNA|nr:uncharacterized protein FOA43_001262 [Brettanomyces nanus]QPG73947.1 hypothetical protein FOA43_001262 [Brettanomyces nanus]
MSTLNSADFIINSTTKRVSLPPLISPKLPSVLLERFSIPQLKIGDICIEQSKSKPRERSGQRSGQRSRQRSPIKPDHPAVNDYVLIAKGLKHDGENKFNGKDYKHAILCFTESLLLFVIDFYLNEKKALQKRQESKHPLKLREKEWISLVKYSLHIVNNFDSLKAEIPELKYLFGLCHYVNGFILKHMINLKEQKLREAMDEAVAQSVTDKHRQVIMTQKLLKLRRASRNSLRKGEALLSLFDVIEKFPHLFKQSKRSIDDVNLEEFILPGHGPEHGIDYCLPIAEHTFSLITMVNFGMFLLKDWAILTGVNDYKWSI